MSSNIPQKTALITGATSGIGRATAYAFADLGIALVLCGRRTERLAELEAELGQKVPVITRAFDTAVNAAVEAALSNLPEPFNVIDILVNNAGNAHGRDPLHTGQIADWDAMIDINVKGLLYVTRVIAPGMVARRSGHIINLGSIAGREVYPMGNVYCASKFAVEALNTAMRQDFNPYNIRVTCISPGMVETEFALVRFKGNEAVANSVYADYIPLSPEDVADSIVYAATRPPHVTIADIMILPTCQGGTAAGLLQKKQQS